MNKKRVTVKKDLEGYKAEDDGRNDQFDDPEEERDEVSEAEERSEISDAEAERDLDCPERELEALRNKYLRLHADYDNYRKRVAKDLSNVRLNAQIDSAMPVIQISDHFEMAVDAAEKADNMDAIREGMRLILVEFDKAMDELGLRKIDAVGKTFDPNLHEAIAEEPSDEEEGVVIKQWRRGYQMGERVIRPANVIVSSGPVGEAK